MLPTNTKQALAQELRQSMLLGCAALEPVGLGNRRLQTDLSGPFLASPLFENTVFLPHSSAMGLQIRQKLASLGPIFALDAPSPTGSRPDRLLKGRRASRGFL